MLLYSRTFFKNTIRVHFSLSDVNECDSRPCEYRCENIFGSYQCACPTGMFLSTDGRTCTGRIIIFFTVHFCIVYITMIQYAALMKDFVSIIVLQMQWVQWKASISTTGNTVKLQHDKVFWKKTKIDFGVPIKNVHIFPREIATRWY